MSIYPCDFNEAWEPLIPPNRPDYYNNQNNEIKKIMKETTYNEIYDSNINNKDINNNNNKVNIDNNQNQKKENPYIINGGNRFYNNITNESSIGDSIHPKYVNKQLNKILDNNNNQLTNEQSINNILLKHIENLEKNMKDLINIVNLHKLENEYKNNTQINDILLYILIGIIIAYIIFNISNRK